MLKKKGWETVIQWIGVAIALLGFVWNGVKDYQKGEIQIPSLPQKEVLTKPVYPVQYCVMAYDPNVDKVFYQHENGQWYDYAPQIRKYTNQGQEALGAANGTQRTSGNSYGQSTQTPAYATRY
jgi:hypothetical protein